MTFQSASGPLDIRTGPVRAGCEPGQVASFSGSQPGAVSTRPNDPQKGEGGAQQSQTILTTLLMNLPGMAYRCRPDRNRTMEYASEGCYELTGYLPVDLIENKNVSFGQLIHPEERSSAWNGIETALQEGKSFDVVYRIVTKDGEEKWIREVGRGISHSENSPLFLEGFISDISDRINSEKRIERQMARFEALRKIDQAINSSLDLRVTLDVLLDQVIHNLDVDAADVLLFNPTAQALEYVAGRGFNPARLKQAQLRLGEGYAGKAALERRTIRYSEAQPKADGPGKWPSLAGETYAAYFAEPLIAKGQVKGVLEVFKREKLDPDSEWIDFLSALAGQAAIAIDNATLFNDLQRSNSELGLAYDSALEGWSRALELRDQETEGHTQRVTEMTLRLARAMGVKGMDLVHIRRGALLHDIGKMAIPDSILLKPGPLTADEWAAMRKHPDFTYELLAHISFLRPALDIPYCHHEKWDGSGYPRGLKGEQIPLAARIFAVADVWDALTSDRPYRLAWLEEKALEYIKENAGLHFDPMVVEVFLEMI